MSIGILFQVLPADLEKRVKTALQALRDGILTDIQVISFFFKYFFERLEPMYRNNPIAANAIQESVKNQEIGLVVHRLVDVTMYINTLSDLKFENGVALKIPSLVFDKLQVIEDILLAHTTLTQILVDKKVKVKKLATILRWLAPITTIQTEEILEKVRDEDLALLDKNLKKIGF
ncbi:MAG: hypothetical protein HWN66_18265 [Candidatus Helarchaeota archaeon]|nr:hypothetical protein [Candidatus Helarchaeota archaeon]